MRRPSPVGDLLAAVFRGTPTEKRLQEGAIWQIWDTAVGPRIAERARPVAIRDGILTVTVSSAPWMQQLTFLKKGIIDKLNGMLRQELVRDINLKAGRLEPAADAPKPPQPTARSLNAAERKQVADDTAEIADEELREAFSRLMTRHLQDRMKKK
ncbi:DUF721 domain-containing protein [Geobacter sp. DSM 9736]|uniref:DUF721 domain-containing protein n=1 Tax=Geobacter sp. DSM 9736 TaxID=1277350 RepID=UPI000B620072|nr:DUF721 domain-containing protein [Geobacter sp. DSM 9736]SNB46592.1 hypothetical protein SAMN06269301_2060 [Geobacter sp. DSM 9736]